MLAYALVFLPMQGNPPRPVVKSLVLRTLLGRPVKNNGQGPALTSHQSVKLFIHLRLEVFAFQGQLVIEVQNGVSGVVEVLFPMVRCTLMEECEPFLVKHGSSDIANQVLHFDIKTVG